MAAEDHRPFAAQGLVWVAEDAGRLIGFATCEAFELELHLWELAVRHEAQRQGVGRALIAAVVDEARTRGLPAVTLTTFRDIPWNAAFYARCGFVEIPEAELGPFLKLVRAKEVEIGLDVANRCAMRLAL
ncbi:MAG: family N-acetyltransferase [Phenylobacterium sp.]|nr:family N-acetyltransferase [Phenylobacterium sp.]